MRSRTVDRKHVSVLFKIYSVVSVNSSELNIVLKYSTLVLYTR